MLKATAADCSIRSMFLRLPRKLGGLQAFAIVSLLCGIATAVVAVIVVRGA